MKRRPGISGLQKKQAHNVSRIEELNIARSILWCLSHTLLEST